MWNAARFHDRLRRELVESVRPRRDRSDDAVAVDSCRHDADVVTPCAQPGRQLAGVDLRATEHLWRPEAGQHEDAHEGRYLRGSGSFMASSASASSRDRSCRCRAAATAEPWRMDDAVGHGCAAPGATSVRGAVVDAIESGVGSGRASPDGLNASAASGAGAGADSTSAAGSALAGVASPLPAVRLDPPRSALGDDLDLGARQDVDEAHADEDVVEVAELGQRTAHLAGPHAAVAHDGHDGVELAGEPLAILGRHRRRQ